MAGLGERPVGHTDFSWLSLTQGRGKEAPAEAAAAAAAALVGHTRFSWGLADDAARKRSLGLNKLGALLLRRGQRREAAGLFRSALALDGGNRDAHFNMANVYDDVRARRASARHFRLASLVSAAPFPDALACQAATLLKLSGAHAPEAVALCERALEADPQHSTALFNLGNALRRCGRRHDAMARAWTALENKSGVLRASLELQDDEEEEEEEGAAPLPGSKLAIVCVKWGDKYGADYVDKLCRGLARNLQAEDFEVFCFTEDGSGIQEPRVRICPLPVQDWEGWWNKASVLFSGHLELHVGPEFARVMYVDLDVIVSDDVSDVASYCGPFAVLGSGEFTATEDRDGGFNSSLMLFPRAEKQLRRVFATIEHFGLDNVRATVHRLDFWLEMLIHDAVLVEEAFPNQVVDFNTHVHNGRIPADARIVIFPLHPKPHELASNQRELLDLWV